jgi:serine/threonine protein kinase
LQSEEDLLKKCHSANVIKLYDVFENKKCKVLVLEYCSGGGLDSYITRRWSLK